MSLISLCIFAFLICAAVAQSTSPEHDTFLYALAVCLPLCCAGVVVMTAEVILRNCKEERVTFYDVLAIELNHSCISMLILDIESGEIVDQISAEVKEDLFSVTPDLHYRFAANLQAVFSMRKIDTVPLCVCVVLPAIPSDELAAEIILGFSEFSRAAFDGIADDVPGALSKISLTTHMCATALGSVIVQKDIMSVRMGTPIANCLVSFDPGMTSCIIFVAIWDSSIRCRFNAYSSEFSCAPLALEEVGRDPLLRSYIERSFDPMMQSVLTEAKKYRNASKIYCALNGIGADSIAIENFLSTSMELAVWVPSKTFHDCSLSLYGAAVGCFPNLPQSFVQCHSFSPIFPSIKYVLASLQHEGRKMALEKTDPEPNFDLYPRPAAVPSSTRGPSANTSRYFAGSCSRRSMRTYISSVYNDQELANDIELRAADEVPPFETA